MKRDIIKLILVFCKIYFCYSKRYDNYTLYRGFPLNDDQLMFFETLDNFYNVNFWRDPSVVKKPIEFTISPLNKDEFLTKVEEKGIYLTTIMENVQSAFDEQTVKAYIRRNMASFDWRNYFRINDVYSWLNDLQRAHPNEVKLNVIGRTYKNRKIISARVFLKKGPSHRPTVIIEGGIHAREWISTAFATYFLNSIVTYNTSKSTELNRIATHYEWIFIPVANPDGYEHSHTEDRLWRKNRRETGVDINRNFGYRFGSVGVSFNKRAEIYCGETAFSENESRAIRDLVIKNHKHLDFYLSFHSYGQYIVIPYAHSKVHQENFGEMKGIARSAAYELKKMYGTSYSIGTAYDTVGYLVSGASTCWVKHTYKVPYVATFELRDQGNYGFALPAEQIIPTCRETMVAMLSILSPKPHSDSRVGKWLSQPNNDNSKADAKDKVFDWVVVLCNIILMIIVRLD